MSRHFMFVTTPAAGHILPTIPLVTELIRRGHRVTYATGGSMLEMVRAAGAEPLEMPFVMPDASPGDRDVSPEDRVRMFAGSVEEVFPELVAALRADPPDAVCGDGLVPVGQLAAQACALPFVCLRPSQVSNEHFSMINAVEPDHPMATALGQAFSASMERLSTFTEEKGLDLPPFGGSGDLTLVFIAREFQIAGDTFDDSFLFLGPSVGERDAQEFDTSVLDDPDGPVLLVSLGTVFNNRPEFFRTCAEAFRDSDWQVVMSIGKLARGEELGELPANVVAMEQVPQIAVLKRARAFVTHNGMGSTMEALLFGVPQVGVPQMVEQYVNAGRVEELGIGRRLDGDTLDAATLRKTVDEIAEDPGVRARAEAFGARMREIDGPALGADALERFVG